VRVIAAGDALLAPGVTRRLIDEFAQRQVRTAQPSPALDELTPRETEVLRLLAEGLSNAEIAARLAVTEETVKTHVSRILLKLGLRDRTQAVIAAYECGPGDEPPAQVLRVAGLRQVLVGLGRHHRGAVAEDVAGLRRKSGSGACALVLGLGPER
jgi:DNA-binding CsgD family transcriptional regulator